MFCLGFFTKGIGPHTVYPSQLEYLCYCRGLRCVTWCVMTQPLTESHRFAFCMSMPPPVAVTLLAVRHRAHVRLLFPFRRQTSCTPQSALVHMFIFIAKLAADFESRQIFVYFNIFEVLSEDTKAYMYEVSHDDVIKYLDCLVILLHA